jgi:hypothetical protein
MAEKQIYTMSLGRRPLGTLQFEGQGGNETLLIAAGRSLCFSVCTRLNLRDCLRLAPEVPDHCLGLLHLSRI